MGLKYVDGKMKKGFFFTMDSILAAGIILTVVILASNPYVKELPIFHLNYMSRDLLRTLSTLTVEEIDNEYLNSLNPSDVDKDNTVLEQIVEFWADDDMVFANKTVSNVTALLVTDITGFGMWIEGEAIYTKDLPIRMSLVSSKKIISGVTKGDSGGPASRRNPPTLFTPVMVEVRVWQ